MSFMCVKCREAWDYEDYTCPCCGSCAVDTESSMPPTLRYEFTDDKGKKINPYKATKGFIYDVIRKSTGKSVFDEPNNYMNEEDAA